MAADEPRRVLMTADTVGGVWNHALELARGLGRHGVRIDLATMGAPLTAQQRGTAARIPTLTLHESAWRLEWMTEPWDDLQRAADWLLALEARIRPDLVHLNQFAFGSLPFAAPTLLVAHSCVLSWWRAVHGEAAPAEWDRYREVVRDGLAGATLVGAPSEAMLAALRDEHAHLSDSVVLPNGRSAQEWSPQTKAPVILSAGRLWDPAKNLAALEAVAPRLAWPVHVAGSTVQPGGGVRATRNVVALGELSPAALARALSHASIYALPARYEPFGQTALEAALSGCALVLGDIPSLREIWGPAALYAAPDDPDALHDCLTALIEDAALRERQAAAALMRARRFTPQRMVDGYLAAYRQARTTGSGRAVRQPTPVQPDVEVA